MTETSHAENNFPNLDREFSGVSPLLSESRHKWNKSSEGITLPSQHAASDMCGAVCVCSVTTKMVLCKSLDIPIQR